MSASPPRFEERLEPSRSPDENAGETVDPFPRPAAVGRLRRIDRLPFRANRCASQNANQPVSGPIITQNLRRRVGPEEVLVVIREQQADGTMKHDYYLSSAPSATPLPEFARVAKAEHRIEDCLQRAKSEAGLGQYQVRTWEGWHHHQTLSLLATWFLTQETRRGKKMDPGDHASADPLGHCHDAT